MPKARSSDRSLASLSRPRCPRPPLPFSSRVSVAFGTPDFGVAAERGAPATESSRNSQERERTSEGGWKTGGAWGRQRGATVGGGYPTRYLNLRLPRGRAQKCKAIVSRPRPVSSSAGSLLYLPEKGNVSRYTRKHRGVGYLSAVRCRCCCLVSSSIYSTGTHDLRNSRRSPVALAPSASLSLFLAPCCICVYSVYPADPQRSSPLTGEADQPASRIYGARNSDDGRSSSHVTSGNSVNFLSLSFCSDSRHVDIFLRAG